MAMIKDLVNDVDTFFNLTSPNAAGNATVGAGAGTGVDMCNDFEEIMLAINVSIITIANVTSMVVQAEESTSSAGPWTAIANVTPGSNCVLTVTTTTAAANLNQATKGFRQKRYARANCVTATGGTTTGGYYGLVAVLQSPRKFTPGDVSPSYTGTDQWPGSAF